MALQTRDPGLVKQTRDPASAVHHFVLHRARGTRQESVSMEGVPHTPSWFETALRASSP